MTTLEPGLAAPRPVGRVLTMPSSPELASVAKHNLAIAAVVFRETDAIRLAYELAIG